MLGIVRKGMESREHGEATAKICAITSILNVVDASDFLSQKDRRSVSPVGLEKDKKLQKVWAGFSIRNN